MTSSATMRQARITAYGPPENLVIDRVPCPRPKAGEVLVRVHAAPVTAGDMRLRSGKVPRGMGLLLRLAIGLRRPRNPPGWSFSGEVAAIGPGVTAFAVGERVFGLTGFKGGAHADFVTLKADGPILPLPSGLDHQEGAAFFFGGLTALDYLIDKAKLQKGERLLVNGATGAVGSAALQIARHLGAQSTAMASEPNHALARRLGAGVTLDYRRGPPEGQFDVVMDVIGTLGWEGARPHLALGGRLLLITAGLLPVLGAAIRPRREGRRVIAGTSSEAKANMARLIEIYHAGGYRPVVGQVLPFDKLAEAHRIAETLHKPGNLVVTMV